MNTVARNWIEENSAGRLVSPRVLSEDRRAEDHPDQQLPDERRLAQAARNLAGEEGAREQ